MQSTPVKYTLTARVKYSLKLCVMLEQKTVFTPRDEADC